MSCSLLESCLFFNEKMADMPSMTEMYKQRYCQDAFEGCARYRVFKALGRENVPADLYPNEIDRATDILTKVKSG